MSMASTGVATEPPASEEACGKLAEEQTSAESRGRDVSADVCVVARGALQRAQTVDQAQKVGAPVSLSQILGRSLTLASRGPCERDAGHAAPIPTSAVVSSNNNNNSQSVRMGHGASCLTGRGDSGHAPSSASNNCSVTSFTPLQPGQRSAPGTVTGAGTSLKMQQPSARVPDDYAYLCGLVPELKAELKEREARVEALQNETLDLKRRLKKRDEDVGRLQREIHKLKVTIAMSLRLD